MIVLSDNRIGDIARIARHRNYVKVAEDFRKVEPRIFAALTEDEAMRFIEICHQRAEYYGYQSMAGLYLLTDISCLIGTDFWRDPFYQRIADELSLRPIHGNDLAFHRTRTQLVETLTILRGAKGETLARALSAFCALSEGDLVKADHSAAAGAMALTERVYPVYIHHYGRAFVTARTEQVIAVAECRYGIAAPPALALYVLISVMLGIGFDRDPLYPWITTDFARTNGIGGEAAVYHVARRLVPWFRSALEEISTHGIN